MPRPSKQDIINRLRAKAMKVHQDRLRGVWQTCDTREELSVAVKQFVKAKDDAFLTMIHNQGVFSVYTMKEFQDQLKEWKKLGVSVLDCNFKECEIDGHKLYFFTAQPKDLETCNICPLAFALNTMVSGYTYIIKNKETYDYVKNYLTN